MGFIIDEEFRTLIPPLTDDEFARLEKSVLAEGVREPIITWNSTIIDGHNRYRICESHGLECPNREHKFASREAAKIWIIENQFGRRNLSVYDRSALALQLEPLYQAEAKRRMSEGGGDKKSGTQKSAEPISDKGETRDKLAALAGVSHDTLRKVKAIEAEAEKGNPIAVEVREELRNGEKKSIHGAYVAVMGKPNPRKPKDTFTEDGRRLCVMCGEPIDSGTAHSFRPTVHKECEQEYQRDWCKSKRNKAGHTDDGRRICSTCGEPIDSGDSYNSHPGQHKKCFNEQNSKGQYKSPEKSLLENVAVYTVESLLAELSTSAESLRESWASSIRINESMGVKLSTADKRRLENAAKNLLTVINRIETR